MLISPMIGITGFARFAGLAALPAMPPGLRQGGVARHRAGVQPVQVQLLPGQRRAAVAPADGGAAGASGDGIRARPAGPHAADADLPVGGRLHGQHAGGGVGPLRTCCRRTAASSCCSTSTALPSSGLLLRSAADTMLSRILADPPRNFRTTIITNAGPDADEVVERVTEAGAGGRADAAARPRVPERHLFAVARRAAVSDERIRSTAWSPPTATSSACSSARSRRAASAAC